MTIEQTDVIDFISTDEDTSDLKLTISDHLEWGNDDGHLYLLQEKINTYLRYIESGEIYDAYPGARDQNIIINVMGKYPLDIDAERFLLKASAVIKEAGFSLKYELLTKES